MKEEQIQKTLETFIELLRNIGKFQERRTASLNRMFWEYNNLNVNEFEDTETKYQKIIPDKRSYANAFMASSLGFNKSTMQVKYNEVLHRFKLDRRPQVASLRNAMHYEKLKVLIIKYYELLKK